MVRRKYNYRIFIETSFIHCVQQTPYVPIKISHHGVVVAAPVGKLRAFPVIQSAPVVRIFVVLVLIIGRIGEIHVAEHIPVFLRHVAVDPGVMRRSVGQKCRERPGRRRGLVYEIYHHIRLGIRLVSARAIGKLFW